MLEIRQDFTTGLPGTYQAPTMDTQVPFHPPNKMLAVLYKTTGDHEKLRA